MTTINDHFTMTLTRVTYLFRRPKDTLGEFAMTNEHKQLTRGPVHSYSRKLEKSRSPNPHFDYQSPYSKPSLGTYLKVENIASFSNNTFLFIESQ